MINKIKPILIFLLVLVIQVTHGQNTNNKYQILTAQADSLFLSKSYRNAVNLYQKAFTENNDLGKVAHRYRAAACFALLHISDSAFIELDKIVNKGKFSYYDMIFSDSNFISLHSDNRWQAILKKIKENKKNKQNIKIDN